MPAQVVYLPNGQTYMVTAVFGGFTFKSSNLDLHHSAMPPGWTVILQTEDEVDEISDSMRRKSRISIIREPTDNEDPNQKRTIAHRFVRPTVQSDSVFISSISMPANSDFKGPTSPTRHIALMLWATLWWYFHKDEPNPHVTTEASALTPELGRPKVDWRIKIKREGIFKGKNIMQKLERMGLIASEDSCVGTDTDIRLPTGWAEAFVSQRAFWQLDPRIFLFTLAPQGHSPFPAQSPHPSRPSSPDRAGTGVERPSPRPTDSIISTTGILPDGLSAGISSPGGPFNSGSHLPTFYPPPPPQYTFTNHIRHPIRPKPPRQGEVFYSRYIPSLDSWLSFRIPSLSSRPVPHPHLGPVGGSLPASALATGTSTMATAPSIPTLPTLASFNERQSDLDLLHRWMNEPRVNAFWAEAGPKDRQRKFLEDALTSRHSFPVFGCWDGRPFGYFEIYWVKEDRLGRLLGGDVGNWRRGLHVLVGEQEFRGPHRVKVWLQALVHYCWLADARTESVSLEPRVDNEKLVPPFPPFCVIRCWTRREKLDLWLTRADSSTTSKKQASTSRARCRSPISRAPS
jgi:N5-hydroxyornithine acetyltransferase